MQRTGSPPVSSRMTNDMEITLHPTQPADIMGDAVKFGGHSTTKLHSLLSSLRGADAHGQLSHYVLALHRSPRAHHGGALLVIQHEQEMRES